MTSRTKDLGESYLQSEELSDEGEDTDTLLAEELRGMYRNRLKDMEEVDEKRDEAHRHQLQSLQSYVTELSDQNEILVKTVEELEREANDRVALMESKLQRTTQSLKEHIARGSELEIHVEKLSKEKKDYVEEIKALKEELNLTVQQLAHLDTRQGDLEYDVENLVNLIGNARATGKWELAGLDLRTVSLDSILVAHASASKDLREGEKRLSDHIAELKKQLAARDQMIQRLQKDLTGKEQVHHKLVDTNAHDNEKIGSFAGDAKSFDIYTEECSGSITQKDVLIRKLKNDLEHARKQQQETGRELRECELSIARLQGQIGKLQDEQMLKQSDVAAKNHTFKAMEKQHMENKVKVARLQEENRELKDKVKSLAESNGAGIPLDLSREFEQRVKRLEAELEVSEEQRRKAAQEVVKLQSQLSESQHAAVGNKEMLVSELSSRDNELDNVKDRYNAAVKEIQQYEKEIRQLRSDHANSSYELEKSKFHIQQLEGDVVKCREQIARSEEECRSAQRELKRLHTDADDQRDALVNEVAERHDVILKLKTEISSLDNKHRDAVAQLTHRNSVMQKLRNQNKEMADAIEESNRKHAELESKLNIANKRVSDLEGRLEHNQMSNFEKSDHLGKMVEEKDAEIRELRSAFVDLKDQHEQAQSKVSHREEALQRLKVQQKDFIEEVARREKAIQKLELELLTAQENHRRALDDISRRDETIKQLEGDLENTRKQLKDTIEENGRLEAKIQAYKISTQSEQDVLAEEVAKREEAIHSLKIEKLALQEQQQKAEENVREHERSVERLRQQYEDCLQDMQQRNSAVVDMEAKLNEMKSKSDEYTDKLEHYEDSIRELNLKMTSLQSEKDQKSHEADIKEDTIQHLAAEMEDLQGQHRDVLSKLSKRDDMIDRLKSETSYLKDQQRDKEKEISQQLDVISQLERDLSESSRALENLRETAAEDVSADGEKLLLNNNTYFQD